MAGEDFVAAEDALVVDVVAAEDALVVDEGLGGKGGPAG